MKRSFERIEPGTGAGGCRRDRDAFCGKFDVLEPLLKKAAQQNSGEPELLAKILELGAVYQENLKNIKHKASYIMGGKTLTAGRPRSQTLLCRQD